MNFIFTFADWDQMTICSSWLVAQNVSSLEAVKFMTLEHSVCPKVFCKLGYHDHKTFIQVDI